MGSVIGSIGSLAGTVGGFLGSNAGNIAKTGAGLIGGALQGQPGRQQQQYNPYQQQQGQFGGSSPISQAFGMMGRNSYNPSWMGGLSRRWGPGGMG